MKKMTKIMEIWKIVEIEEDRDLRKNQSKLDLLIYTILKRK